MALIAWNPLNGDSSAAGGDAVDWTGNGYTLTFQPTGQGPTAVVNETPSPQLSGFYEWYLGSPLYAYSYLFDGVDDYFGVDNTNSLSPGHNAWNIGTKDFLISFWAKFSADQSAVIFQHTTRSIGIAEGWMIYYQNGSPDRIYMLGFTGNVQTVILQYDWSADTNWHFWVFRRVATACEIILDGVQVATSTSAYDFPLATSSALISDANPSITPQPYAGYLTDLRLYIDDVPDDYLVEAFYHWRDFKDPEEAPDPEEEDNFLLDSAALFVTTVPPDTSWVPFDDFTRVYEAAEEEAEDLYLDYPLLPGGRSKVPLLVPWNPDKAYPQISRLHEELVAQIMNSLITRFQLVRTLNPTLRVLDWDLGYVPANPQNWNTAPTKVGEALDMIAKALVALGHIP